MCLLLFFSLKKIQNTVGEVKLYLCNYRLVSYKYDNMIQNAGEVGRGILDNVLNLYQSDQIGVAIKR